jgi:hypothetical protein
MKPVIPGVSAATGIAQSSLASVPESQTISALTGV